MKKHVAVGVTGGIACYKALDVISRLRKEDVDVTVIMTEHATRFVEQISFQTLSQNPVVIDMFAAPNAWEVEHIAIAKKADLFLIVPATANCIGKIAAGIADDMLTTTVMATRKPVLFAPAMNTAMYENPIFLENVDKLKRHGYLFVEPAHGLLACGDVGAGKLAEPERIVEEALAILRRDMAGDLAGMRILVTAGPTVEDIDPIRFITNNSSGKMGFAIAEAAYRRGAEVTLIAGPVSLGCSSGIERIDVRSTADMAEAVNTAFERTDAVIMAAAPSDYRVDQPSAIKLKKTGGAYTMTFVENEDILAGLGRKKGEKILIGFAAETHDLATYARDKLSRKNLDHIVANDVSQTGAGFKGDTNIISIFSADGSRADHPQMTKSDAADIILDLLRK